MVVVVVVATDNRRYSRRYKSPLRTEKYRTNKAGRRAALLCGIFLRNYSFTTSTTVSALPSTVKRTSYPAKATP